MPSRPRSSVSVSIDAGRHLGADVVEQRRRRPQVVVLLGVVADVDVVAERRTCPRSAVGLAGEDAQQARLAGAVEAEHEQPLAAAEVEGDVLEHRRAAVRLATGRARVEHGAPARRRVGEPHRAACGRACGTCTRCGLEAGDALLHAVGHRRLGGLGAEAVDDGLQAGDLLGLQQRPAWPGAPRRRPGRCGTGVYVPLYSTRWPTASSCGPVEVEHPGDRLVEQLEVVADHQQRPAVGAQEAEQPLLASMSRWLVGSSRQQHVAAGEQDAGELDAAALAARRARRSAGRAGRPARPSPAAIARASLSAA